jgi:hypothetical protein
MKKEHVLIDVAISGDRIENSIICAMNNNYRIAATLYTLEMLFALGIRINVNTLHIYNE